MFRHVSIDRNGALLCDVQQYARHHNVVYETPAKTPQNGLPLGNGIMGGLVYHTDRELCMRICRTDSFDYGESASFGAWAHELEEKTAALASCGMLKLTDGTPTFAWEYLDEYNMTLDLGRAEIEMTARSPLSAWHAKGCGSLKHNCILWEAEVTSPEPLCRTVTLERYGTRAFFHYYESFTRDTGRRLTGITARVTDGAMLVTQKLCGCTFTTAVRVECEGAKYDLLHSREVRCILPAAEKQTFRLILTTALSRTGEDTEEMALRQLSEAAADSDLYADHLAWWKSYWNRSFLQVEDRFAENFWYMNRYQMGSSGFGSFPPSVFGSLWTACGDIRNWGHIYHWNDQMQFWPCDAWDSGDLLQPYFRCRRELLPQAMEDARNVHGLSGAWYSDISSADGKQAAEPDTARNMTCGGLLALQMYRHYRHYPEKDFLLNTAYPVMKACGDLYLDLLQEGDDGLWHIRSVTALEGYLYLDDTITDWAVIRGLFTALLDVAETAGADEAQKSAWQDRLQRLYAPPTWEKDGKILFAYGRHPDGRSCTGGVYPESDMGMSPAGALMCVFPAGLYDAFSPADEYTAILQNTAEAFRSHRAEIGWDPIAISLAHLGYTEDTWDCIGRMLQDYVIFPNCLTHYNPAETVGSLTACAIPKNAAHTPWGDLHEKDKGERVIYSAERFVHFYSEPEGVISTAMNDSLLLSHDGVLHVFPAAGDGVFRLHAQGDFMVTAEKQGGTVRFVSVESRRGGTVTLDSPFAGNESVRCQRDEVPFQRECTGTQQRIRFETTPGKTYIVFSRADHLDGSYPTFVEAAPNTAPKTFAARTVGLRRDF